MTSEQLAWEEPLHFASRFRHEEQLALLHSASANAHTGRYSFLAVDVAETIESEGWQALESAWRTGDPMLDSWFGYLGYGMRLSLESLRQGTPMELAFPAMRMARFHTIYRFDHIQKELLRFSHHQPASLPPHAPALAPAPAILSLASNMTKAEYLDAVTQTVERIHAGDFYQANITRKFSGSFAELQDALALFEMLCQSSPAPYAALLKHGSQAVLSTSPESFLECRADGKLTTRPIKGTAARSDDEATDKAAIHSLRESPKDRAENLMIVDLVRHDLSRVSDTGSVTVDALCEAQSSSTVHHLVSTVSSQLRDGLHSIDAIKACFPPGSMTGAPKIAAMDWCAEVEQVERGVYSGAIGRLGGDGSADLSVIIRTLLVDGAEFEFQVGGGIVSDSVPEAEWQETLVKARGIGRALGIAEKQLAAL